MKTFIPLLAAALFLAPVARAQVPGIITYQGRVTADGTNFTGSGRFKFALLDGGSGKSLWSHNGSSVNGSEPTAGVSIPVADGLFTVALGDTTLAGMTVAIPASAFANDDVRLRVWFSVGELLFTQLAPDQRMTSVGYAMMSASVVDGAITGAQIADESIGPFQLADGSVTTPKLANMAVTGPKVTNELVLGHATASGALRLVSAFSDLVSIELNGLSADIRSFGTDGLEDARLAAGLNGQLLLNDGAGNDNTVDLNAGSATGGSLALKNSSGSLRSSLLAEGAFDGGELRLRNAASPAVTLFGNAPDTVNAGLATGGGGFDIFGGAGSRRLALRGASGTLSLYQNNGDAGVILRGQGGSGTGEIDLHDSADTRRLSLQGLNGQIEFFNEAGAATMRLTGDTGELTALSRVGVANSVNASVLQASFGLDSNGGLIRTRDENDHTTTLIGSASQGGFMRLYRSGESSEGVVLDGDDGNGGAIAVKDNNGTPTIRLIGAQTSDSGSRVELGQANGALTVILDGEVGNGGGGYLQLRKGNGTGTITLDADSAGEGRITTQVLQITGGSDLSEQFDVRSTHDAPQPGMIVSIDPQHPGELAVSTRAYDRKVAGVMSGAGGVKPGMLMGQAGSKADGQHPVALTGRVYCLIDASSGAIEPGDLITTSATPGHGMKVTDHARAQGAIIGKAMTGLAGGKGLVLLLVNLH